VNLPNKITVGRFLASLVFFLVLIIMEAQDGTAWIFPLVAMFLFILVVSTDALDGYYARKFNLTTDFGRIADPVVDKIMICGTFILLTASHWAGTLLPAWVVVLIVAREFMVSGLRGYIESKGVKFGANWAGKSKMVAQSVAIPSIFFYQVLCEGVPEEEWLVNAAFHLSRVIIAVTLILTLYSGFLYVTKAAQILKAEEDA
jgi:CDP-diacylglycerol--glycerol-3-phosphate 3-phosphatidyltransferase